MKQKFLKIIATLTTVVTILSLSVGVFAVSNPQEKDTKYLTKEDFKSKIEKLEKYVERSSDGTLNLNVDVETAKKMGFEEKTLRGLKDGMTENNKRIKKGELVTTKNLTIYDKNDKFFIMQGGVNYYEIMWWGHRAYLSTQNATSCAIDLSNVAYGTAPAGVALSRWFKPAIIVAGVGCYFGWLSNKINLVNGSTSRGIVVDITWVFNYSVYPQ